MVKNEAQILEKLQDDLLQIPKYYHFFEESDISHLLMLLKAGTTLTTALGKATSLEKKKLFMSFGRFLNCFYEKSPLKSLEREGNWLESQLEKAKSYVDCGETEGDLELLESLILNRPIPVNQTMIHGDCNTDETHDMMNPWRLEEF
ncbi:hypothetical protein [Paenibacillus qinlingensis]|uniref:Aminoglycoside 3'-phosphotransferase-2 n=1 Tax=Paenibacillus qinlingensis TaxID=1837343 RepID=A0ABU1P5E6_9BACL|nr:hypothetical protein [Paenibacillus qinlingensis]MDR6554966.1 aminoglycoside 3'-phosphotransferase-2 [Paenibacillus qinlingensis]